MTRDLPAGFVLQRDGSYSKASGKPQGHADAVALYGKAYVETLLQKKPKKRLDQSSNNEHNNADNSRHGAGARSEEPKICSTPQRRDADTLSRRTRKSVEKKRHKQFRVAIMLRFSDDRVHDPDGCAATILDCLITARRQMAEYTPADRSQ